MQHLSRIQYVSLHIPFIYVHTCVHICDSTKYRSTTIQTNQTQDLLGNSRKTAILSLTSWRMPALGH